MELGTVYEVRVEFFEARVASKYSINYGINNDATKRSLEFC